jgi:hypothetical protein
MRTQRIIDAPTKKAWMAAFAAMMGGGWLGGTYHDTRCGAEDGLLRRLRRLAMTAGTKKYPGRHCPGYFGRFLKS